MVRVVCGERPGTRARFLRSVVGALVVAGVGLVAAPAFAAPATANLLQLGVGFRYGLDLTSGDTLNPWAAGVGVDGGYTFPSAAFLGGSVEYFFGEQVGDDTNGAGANLWQLSAEGGYDMGAGSVVFRPKLGLGFANVHEKSCAPANTDVASSYCTSNTTTDFALLPGATFIVMSPGFSVTADLRYELVFASQTGQGLLFALGVGF